MTDFSSDIEAANERRESKTHLDAFLRGHHQQITRGQSTKCSLKTRKHRICSFVFVYDA